MQSTEAKAPRSASSNAAAMWRSRHTFPAPLPACLPAAGSPSCPPIALTLMLATCPFPAAAANRVCPSPRPSGSMPSKPMAASACCVRRPRGWSRPKQPASSSAWMQCTCPLLHVRHRQRAGRRGRRFQWAGGRAAVVPRRLLLLRVRHVLGSITDVVPHLTAADRASWPSVVSARGFAPAANNISKMCRCPLSAAIWRGL